MNALNAHLQQRLDKRKVNGNYRVCRYLPQACIDFASNDYLGFLQHGMIEAFMKEEGVEARGWGSGGSRLLAGHTLYCEELEGEIARFHQAEDGLIFNSGYAANLGLLGAVATAGDTIIYDQDVHASLHDAVRLSRACALPFRHGDLAHLNSRLKQRCGKTFVCIESVYSCDGTQPNLAGIARLCLNKGAHLIIDEAHATGWAGTKGEGLVQAYGLQDRVFARVHTFSKALGGQGAIVLGSRTLKESLMNFARPFIYTTALPLNSLKAIHCGYRALASFQWTRENLHKVIRHFRKIVDEASLPFVDSAAPIQCLRIPGNEEVKRAAKRLQNEGFDVRPLLSPTVRQGKECLRICLHAFNQQHEVDALVMALKSIYFQKGH